MSYTKSEILGLLNTNKGAFSGTLDISSSVSSFYDDYSSGPVVNLSLSSAKIPYATSTVRIKGDLTGTIPSTWNLSGVPVTNNAAKFNELTIIYINDSDIRVVNRTITITDTEAPTIPLNLSSANISSNSFILSWDASTDYIGVASYNIYQDDVFLKNVFTNTSLITGLSPSTSYGFKVSALDGAGNQSAKSASLTVVTIAVSDVTPLNLVNLDMWFDGTDSSTMSLSGSNVLSIADKKGNYTLAKESSTNANAPVFSGGKITTDENNNRLVSATGTYSPILGASAGYNFHGFIIFKNLTATVGDLFDCADGSAGLTKRFSIAIREAGYLSITGTTPKSIAFTDTSNIHKLEFQSVNGAMTAYLDGVELTVTGNTPYTTTIASIAIAGANSTGGKKSLDFYEIFIQSGAMTTTERNQMLTYIVDKYGI